MSSRRDNKALDMESRALLQQLGLSSVEAAVYVSNLEVGARPASVIAKRAGLKRGHTYNILETLCEQGLAQVFAKDGVKHFSSSAPESLISLLDNREEEIREQKNQLAAIIPYLQRLRNPALGSPSVRYFSGEDGIKEIYEDTIRKKGETIYALTDFETTFPKDKNSALHDWIWRYSDRRASRDIYFVGIVNHSPASNMAYKKRRAQKRKMKMLQDVALPVEVNIYGNKVAMMSTSEDMLGVIIDDAPIAETLRNFHKAIWGFLPDYSPT